MDSSFGTLRFDPALSKISLGAKKLDHRVSGVNNLNFGFNSLRISDLFAILPLFLRKDSAFGYSLRRNKGKLIENLC
jgi:hypothetical protein